MSDQIREFATEVVGNLSEACGPVDWFGIRDERIEELFPEGMPDNGAGFQQEWAFLRIPRFVTPRERAIIDVARFSLLQSRGEITDFAALASDIGGGSVMMELNATANLRKIVGLSVLGTGSVGRNRLGAQRWVGLALPKPDFGLTCLLREVTAAAPPYAEAPHVVGFEWFVQGLNEPATQNLAKILANS